jgi:hypothetical protein
MLTDGMYRATVTLQNGPATLWSTPEPLPLGKLIDELIRLGCHTTDIADAAAEADPNWLTHSYR